MNVVSLIELQLTIFLLLITGLFLTKRGILDRASGKRLNALLIHFLLPCNIITSFVREFNLEILRACAYILIASFVVQALSVLAGHVFFVKSKEAHRQVLHYSAAVSNAGFLGIPVSESIFGPIGVLYASIYLIPQRIVMWTAGVSCFEKGGKRDALKRVVTHPCMIAVEIGLVIMLFQIPLPAFLYQTLDYCGRCTTALSMLLIGSALYGTRLREIVTGETLWFCTVRLIIIPLAMLAICKVLHFDATVTGVATMLSGMPAATTSVIVAEDYGGDAQFAAEQVCISTLLSLVTIPLITWLSL